MTIDKGVKKVALITGGAVGIGAAVANRLSEQGLVVVLADVNIDMATQTAAELVAVGRQAFPLSLDVSDPESITAGFAWLKEHLGRCDVLVNCAGVAKVFPFVEFPLDNWNTTMTVNVTGTMLCGQHAARLMMQEKWGRIVNIASVAGMRAVGSGRTAYGTSKAAVIGLTRQMAVELAEYNITVNAVAPGPVDTPMTQVLHTDQFRHDYSSAIPMNRYGTTDEIAATVGFLVSPAASYLTGVALPVDGGFLASGARNI